MTDEGKANLLRAYRLAVEAGQDGIADMLEDVILAEMCAVPATFGSNGMAGTPRKITCGPDTVFLGGTMGCIGTEPMSKEES